MYERNIEVEQALKMSQEHIPYSSRAHKEAEILFSSLTKNLYDFPVFPNWKAAHTVNGRVRKMGELSSR